MRKIIIKIKIICTISTSCFVDPFLKDQIKRLMLIIRIYFYNVHGLNLYNVLQARNFARFSNFRKNFYINNENRQLPRKILMWRKNSGTNLIILISEIRISLECARCLPGRTY